MQKKRLSLLLAAGAIAGLFTVAQAPDAKAEKLCTIAHNQIFVTYNSGGKDDYCKGINRDIQLTSMNRAKSNGGIVWAKVKTEGESGSCTFYLITREGELHRRFDIRAFQDEKTTARANTYFGFRLGC